MTKISPREQKKVQKRARIIEAALAVFSEMGYVGASLDEIAKRAEVSKPTLYQYFGNKEQLFGSVLEDAAGRILAPLNDPEQQLPSMVATLLNFSQRYAQIVLSPAVLSMGRLVIGVVERFPEVGRLYYNSGPQQALNGITAYLDKQAQAGNLQLDDPELAAHDFWSLILSAPREMQQLMPDQTLNEQDINRFIFNGLKIFLKAYATHPKQDLLELEALEKEHRST